MIRSTRSVSALAVAFATTAAAIAGCGIDTGVVGGDCAAGFEPGGSGCVRVPTGSPSATPGTDPASTQPPSADGGTTGVSGGDAGGEIPSDDGGSDPTADAAPDPCGPAPLMRCNGVCIDTSGDEYNCGRCGHVCSTLICSDSQCVGSLPGELMLIGHDYAATVPWTTAQARVLTNSVFVREVPLLRVMAYQRYADPSAIDAVTNILTSFATRANRQIAINATTSDEVVASGLEAESYDVFLLYDEPNAPAGALERLGRAWQATLTSYTRHGGVVVVLDGATAPEMPALVTGAGLLALNAQSSIAESAQVQNLSPGDAVGTGVESPYRVSAHSAFFSAEPQTSNVVYVVYDEDDQAPVVIHKVLEP